MRITWLTTRDGRRVRAIFYEREVGLSDDDLVMRTVKARLDDPGASPASRYVDGADGWVVVSVDVDAARPRYVMATMRHEPARFPVAVSGAGMPPVVPGWVPLGGRRYSARYSPRYA